MANGEPDTLTVGFGRWRLGVTGSYVVLIVSLLLIGSINAASNLWSGWRIENRLEHVTEAQNAYLAAEFRLAQDERRELRRGQEVIARGQDRAACVLTMSPAERSAFRQSRQSFSRWCAWVDD